VSQGVADLASRPEAGHAPRSHPETVTHARSPTPRMTSALIAAALSLALATALTPLVLRVARARRLFDAPDVRKVHVAPTPRLGGVAIVLAFYAPVTGLLLVDAGASRLLTDLGPQLVGLYLGGLAIAAIGLYDDLRGANASQKLAVQLAVAVAMVSLGFRVDAVTNPFGGPPIALGLLGYPLGILWFVGVMNAVNLIDGLDGLAGGVGFISVGTLLGLSVINQHPLAVLLSAALAGALGGFLLFNFNPARIFMGDTGSLFLGFILAALSISTSTKAATTVAIAIPLLVLAIPILDTAMAIGRRLRAHRPVFSADQDHLHHKLLRAGLTHRGAVLTLYAVAIALSATAFVVRLVPPGVAVIPVVVAGLAVVAFILYVGRRAGPAPPLEGAPAGPLDAPPAAGPSEASDPRILAAGLLDVADAPALAEVLGRCVELPGIVALELHDGARSLFTALRKPAAAESFPALVRARVPLSGPGPGGPFLAVHLAEPSTSADEAGLRLLERLAPDLHATLTRLGWPTLQDPVLPLQDRAHPAATVALHLARTLTGRHKRSHLPST
jgi:UDP-N-acetylmuramyl pentapeptide phosphotransferase/UDP-N-acetylglucosamine-1-phosphate transferase